MPAGTPGASRDASTALNPCEVDHGCQRRPRTPSSDTTASAPTYRPARRRLVALRFEVLKDEEGGDARIDDVLVDPRMRC